MDIALPTSGAGTSTRMSVLCCVCVWARACVSLRVCVCCSICHSGNHDAWAREPQLRGHVAGVHHRRADFDAGPVFGHRPHGDLERRVPEPTATAPRGRGSCRAGIEANLYRRHDSQTGHTRCKQQRYRHKTFHIEAARCELRANPVNFKIFGAEYEREHHYGVLHVAASRNCSVEHRCSSTRHWKRFACAAAPFMAPFIAYS